MRIPKHMLPHVGLVAYQPYLGQTGRGKQYGAEVIVQRANIQEKTSVIPQGADKTAVSRATIWLDPEHHIPLESKVRVWVGRSNEFEAVVEVAKLWEQGNGLPEHVEIRVV